MSSLEFSTVFALSSHPCCCLLSYSVVQFCTRILTVTAYVFCICSLVIITCYSALYVVLSLCKTFIISYLWCNLESPRAFNKVPIYPSTFSVPVNAITGLACATGIKHFYIQSMALRFSEQLHWFHWYWGMVTRVPVYKTTHLNW